jgi:hypothetical protein
LTVGNREAGEDHAAGSSHDVQRGPSRREELAMAGNEQRPTDDVEGHGNRFPEDQTTGDDRGLRQPDDTEGHAWRWSQDTEAVDEDQAGGDDTEGHIRF